MGRHKKTIAAVPDAARDDWMRQVGRQGGGIFLRIHARSPGLKGRFPIVAMNQAMSDIDDLEEHCYESWGEDKEFKIFPLDASEQPAKDAAGIELPPLVIRPRRAPMGAAATAAPVVAGDPLLADEQKRLAADRSRLDIDRERMRIEAERKELDKVKAGGTVPTGEADPLWPLGRGVPFSVIQVSPGEFIPVPLGEEEFEFPNRRGRFGRDREREPRPDPMANVMAMMIESNKMAQAQADRQMQLMITIMTRPDPVIQLLPALLGQQMKMPEMMAMVEAMRRGDQAAMKASMEFNSSVMEKVADHMLDAGVPDDIIDKAKRIGDAVTDLTGKLVKQTTGRESLLNPDKPKALPAPDAAKPRPQPVAARKPTPPGAPIDATPQPLPAPPPQPKLQDATPEDEAKAEGARRCKQILDLHEREMRILSDPALVFQDEADAKRIVEFVLALPKSARAAIDKGGVAAIYEAFKEFVPAQVETLFALMEDEKAGKDRTEWASEFWGEVRDEVNGDDENEEPEHPQRVAE